MPALTVSYLFDIERRMQIVGAEEYQRLLSNLWFRRVTKEFPMDGKSLRLQWLMDTAGIQYTDRLGGGVEFEELMMNSWEFTAKAATNGFKLNVNQFKDVDGGGINLAASWARQTASYGAYWPQKQVAATINGGAAAASLGYDGVPFFATNHPINPLNTAIGTYANLLTSTASGIYPGAVPIDVANASTVDVAFNNLQKAIAYINGGLTMPNGVDPRFLKVRALIVPTALTMRAQQLTNAKFIAQAASSGGGSGDVEAVVRNWGIGEPIEAPELGSAFGGSDTDYYLAAETITSDPVGAILYGNREPFSIVYNTGMTDAQLQVANELQWSNRGRNVFTYGHPYLLFRCKAT